MINGSEHTTLDSNGEIEFSPSTLLNNFIKSSDRKYLWYFIGSIYTSRQEMIDKFLTWKEKENDFNKKDVSEQIEYYSNSVFVLNGRGENLNCLRIYEAVVCGDEEKQKTFCNLDNPPFIFSNTWDNALNECKLLYSNKRLLIWWHEYNNKIKNEIHKIINL